MEDLIGKMSSIFDGEKFDALKFAMAERLPQDLWNRSVKKRGLVVVATKVNSVPKDVVFPVNTSPVQFIKDLSKSEGIDQEKVDEIVKQLKDSEKEVAEEV